MAQDDQVPPPHWVISLAPRQRRMGSPLRPPHSRIPSYRMQHPRQRRPICRPCTRSEMVCMKAAKGVPTRQLAHIYQLHCGIVVLQASTIPTALALCKHSAAFCRPQRRTTRPIEPTALANLTPRCPPRPWDPAGLVQQRPTPSRRIQCRSTPSAKTTLSFSNRASGSMEEWLRVAQRCVPAQPL